MRWRGQGVGGARRSRKVEPTLRIETARVISTSAMAVCVKIGGEDTWIPRSQMRSISTEVRGEDAEIVITEWIAKQKGILP